MALDYRSKFSDINKIIELGIKRPVPKNKIEIHFGSFEPIQKLLTALNLDAGIFDEKDALKRFYFKSCEILKKLQTKLPDSTISDELKNAVYDYLCEEDSLKKADVIFIFGGKNVNRAKKAGELFAQGFAPVIYCAGSHPFEEPNRPNEGETFKNFLIEYFNISSKKIIADPNKNSIASPENVRGFLNYNDEHGHKFESVILVTAGPFLRRGWAIFSKYVTTQILIRQAAEVPDYLSRKNWFRNDLGIKLIYEEYEKIKTQQMTNTT